MALLLAASLPARSPGAESRLGRAPQISELLGLAWQRPAPPGPQVFRLFAPLAAELGRGVSARTVAAAASGLRRALLWAARLR